MSDYGDEYSDYGDEWLYVEDEYMAADDLAEHAVPSPPPTTYGDEDKQAEWDRFDYFNDLEYGSDGYDDAASEEYEVKDAKTGQKRKRVSKQTRANKRRSTANGGPPTDMSRLEQPPIVWRTQKDRESAVEVLDDNAQSYSLLKDWREKMADIPCWARTFPAANSPNARPSRPDKDEAGVAVATAPVSPPYFDEEDGGDELDEPLSREALMASLQRQLSTAGGPLRGMDPQQLLAFAMRMASDQDAGDDIAGEMADAILEGGEDEEGEAAEGSLLSWVAQQRNANKGTTEGAPSSPFAAGNRERPPTPPSSEVNRTIRTCEATMQAVEAKSSLKRKAVEDEDEDADATQVVKKRATRSFNAPTVASQARAAPGKTTRPARGKKS